MHTFDESNIVRTMKTTNYFDVACSTCLPQCDNDFIKSLAILGYSKGKISMLEIITPEEEKLQIKEQANIINTLQYVSAWCDKQTAKNVVTFLMNLYKHRQIDEVLLNKWLCSTIDTPVMYLLYHCSYTKYYTQGCVPPPYSWNDINRPHSFIEVLDLIGGGNMYPLSTLKLAYPEYFQSPEIKKFGLVDACGNNNKELVRWMITKINVDVTVGAVKCACKYGHVKVLKEMVKLCPKIMKSLCTDNTTILQNAFASSNCHTIEFLLKYFTFDDIVMGDNLFDSIIFNRKTKQKKIAKILELSKKIKTDLTSNFLCRVIAEHNFAVVNCLLKLYPSIPPCEDTIDRVFSGVIFDPSTARKDGLRIVKLLLSHYKSEFSKSPNLLGKKFIFRREILCASYEDFSLIVSSVFPILLDIDCFAWQVMYRVYCGALNKTDFMKRANLLIEIPKFLDKFFAGISFVINSELSFVKIVGEVCGIDILADVCTFKSLESIAFTDSHEVFTRIMENKYIDKILSRTPAIDIKMTVEHWLERYNSPRYENIETLLIYIIKQKIFEQEMLDMLLWHVTDLTIMKCVYETYPKYVPSEACYDKFVKYRNILQTSNYSNPIKCTRKVASYFFEQWRR